MVPFMTVSAYGLTNSDADAMNRGRFLMVSVANRSGSSAPRELKVEPDEVFPCKTEEWFNAPVIFDGLPHHKPEQDP